MRIERIQLVGLAVVILIVIAGWALYMASSIKITDNEQIVDNIPPASTFVFSLPWDDNAQNITDLSFLNHKPAGSLGHITVGPDGHFYAGDQRIRFLGVNIGASACFPDHETAEKIAGRLAKFGVNIVRFHFMDHGWSGSIFDYSYPDTRHLDDSALDRLDYFFAELKEKGIYADINLLVARNFESGDGLPSSIDAMDWKDKQTPAMFDQTMIDLQKEYATNLLDRTNPYTGTSYLNDSAVAFIEITNEHGLIHAWLGGSIDRLPSEFLDELKLQWNTFLQNRYATHENLESVWFLSEPLGAEMLLNNDFSSDLAYWNFEQHEDATANISVTNEGPSGENSVRIQVTNMGSQNWHIQLNQGGLTVETGRVYTVKFWAKADRSTTARVQIGQAHAPWYLLGFDEKLSLTTSWQQFEFVLALSDSDTNARLNFTDMADELATYWFADVSLRPGGEIGLFPDENLDSGTIRIFTLSEREQRTGPAEQDWVEFLWETEENYWLGMYDHLKDNLGVTALVTGTVVGNSTPNMMNKMDFVDSHAYWQHPSFPPGEEWGPVWWCRNSSMVGERDGGTITGLGMKRVYGKPFTVSEYDHPFPNTFDSETTIFLSAYTAFQDWDGIFIYSYAGDNMEWSEDKISSFFDFDRHPGKMISLIPAAYIFRRGDLSPANNIVTVSLNKNEELGILPYTYAWRLVDAEHKGMARETPLIHGTSIIPEGGTNPPGALSPSDVTVPADDNFLSDTNEINWDAGNGILKVDTGGSKALLGYVIGQEFNLSSVTIRPQAALQDWAVITMTLIQGDTIEHNAEKILITAIGAVANTDMGWRIYPDTPTTFPPPADVNITLENWGTAPTIVEGIGCEFVLPYDCGKVNVYALGSTGERKQSLQIFDEGGKAKFRISSMYETPWYEVEVQP